MSDHYHYDEIIVNKFTEESARDFRKRVISKAVQDSSMPIIIYVDSYGGYIDSLNNMLETLEQIPNPIVTVCTGKAMSCGAVLLSAGDYRFCGRHSRVMVHQGSGGTVGPIESMQNDVDESKRLNKQIMQMLADRTGMTLSEFKKEMKERLVQGDDEARNLYLPPEASLEMGLVDFIGMPQIKPTVLYQIEASQPKEYETPEPKPKKKTTRKKATKKKVSKKKTRKR